MRPFRFGVIVRSVGSRAEWGGQARKLEDLTDGRLELGLGAGNGESEYEQAGRALRSGRRPYALVGTVDQLVEDLQARRTR